ncbi:MAG: cupin domain-containing protein [Chitinophagaceae bacterium]|nr:cupin domain-containing protein [Chitinophagaceae bacterium]
MESNEIFQKGQQLPKKWFTGNAFLNPLLDRDKNNEFSVGVVTFEAGARTNWHTHPKGQVLIVIEGSGFYQERGKPARVIKKGDVVNIPEGIEHWHGASSSRNLVHIAITNFKNNIQVNWLQPVTDNEYASVAL